jgi:hypothetical protein
MYLFFLSCLKCKNSSKILPVFIKNFLSIEDIIHFLQVYRKVIFVYCLVEMTNLRPSRSIHLSSLRVVNFLKFSDSFFKYLFILTILTNFKLKHSLRSAGCLSTQPPRHVGASDIYRWTSLHLKFRPTPVNISFLSLM